VILNDIVQRIKDLYIQNWFSELENYAKLDTYRTFKVILYSYLTLKKMNERITDS